MNSPMGVLRGGGNRSRVRDGGLLFLKLADGEASPPMLLWLLLLLPRKRREALLHDVGLMASKMACSGVATMSYWRLGFHWGKLEIQGWGLTIYRAFTTETCTTRI
jgi:hypothetical protein